MDTNKLKELAERAHKLGRWYWNPTVDAYPDMAVDQDFMLAANPQAILGLIQELEENEGVINVWRGRTQRAEAEVERLRKLEARQQEITEHYKKWFKEIVYESFDEWLKDDATHWIGEEDAALQAWQYLHENKIWLMKERIEEHEQERDRLKAENAALRQFAAEAYQVLGALDAPENVLDNASDAANGAPLRHETLLPFFAEDYEELRKDAERYRFLCGKERGCVVVRDRTSHLFGESLDAAIDAALEGDGR